MNLYRSIGLVICLATLSFVGCSEDGGEASASATVDEQVQAASFEMTLDGDESSKPKSAGRAAPTTTAPARLPSNLARNRTDYDLGASVSSKRDSFKDSSISTNPEDYIVRAEPDSLDFGEIGTGEKVRGSFLLVNTGDTPMTILTCKGNCGCTVPKCPAGTIIMPGEPFEVEVIMSAGKQGGRKLSKQVDIVIEGQPKLRVPVTADVVAYVELSPSRIGPSLNTDGRLVIRGLDETPFRITGMIPPLIEDGIDTDAAPQLEHVLFLSWDVWKEKGSPRQLKFMTDHPRVKELSVIVQATRPRRGLIDRTIVATINADNAVAARNGDVEKILAVTKTKEDLELVDSGGATLLSIAASAGQTEVVSILVEAKAKVNTVDKKGRTPLMAAILKRDTNIETLKALIAGGADVNTRGKRSGAPVLSWAAGPFGSAAEVRVLLEAGSDVNVVDGQGDTPLMWAARYGSAEAVEAMLQAGADIAIVNSEGMTALGYINKRQTTKASVISEITSLLEESTNTQE
ncbi:MAG: ankyrin repeat domain-containing protein [Planctomycetes bacterium]|nr:ankyrin repeat domain-containing protein [Planctomycetota bacterium]